MEELREVLVRCASDWARWLATSANPWAKETLSFLERALMHHPPNARQSKARRLRDANSGEVDAILHELLIYEVCYRFGLDPSPEPNTGGKAPDFTLKIADQVYIADVFLTNRPQKTEIKFGDLSGFRDGGEAAKKIADVVSGKARWYRSHAPLILFVVFAGNNVAVHDLETALYGAAVNEVLSTGGLATDCPEDWNCHGAFCPPGPEARHREVSAVISCDWFDTLAREKPGRRLSCVVYHHWDPFVALAPGSFGRFKDVYWRRDESGLFAAAISGEPGLVMSTTSGDEPEWALYSADRPW